MLVECSTDISTKFRVCFTFLFFYAYLYWSAEDLRKALDFVGCSYLHKFQALTVAVHTALSNKEKNVFDRSILSVFACSPGEKYRVFFFFQSE